MKSNNEQSPATKRGRKPKGLGDVVEAITTATGIKAAVDWFSEATGVDCGCDARKAKLNKLFPIANPECLTKEEHDFIGTIIGAAQFTHAQRVRIAEVHARVFRHKFDVPCTCSPKLWSRWIKSLTELHTAYEV